MSRNLANRARLREELGGIDADVFLTEIKAAAIDVVAEAAAERGAEVVFADNEVVPLAGEPDLDEQLLGWPRRRLASRWPDERAQAHGSTAARRRRALLQGADGPRADARRRHGRARLRARAAHRAGPARPQGGPVADRTRAGARHARCSARKRARRRSERLRRYHDLAELDLPIIVLIGGATGTGKSTVATEVAYRLGHHAASPRPTSFGRRCARSSARSSCRRSTTPASKPGKGCAAPRRRRSTRSCTGSSTRRETSSSA